MYIKLTNGVPEVYTLGRLRDDNPQVSFPENIPDSILEEYEVYPVTELLKPNIDPETHRHSPPNFHIVDGVWKAQLDVVPLPELQAAENMRKKRDRLLAETDWIVVAATEQQVVISDEWKQYRQHLRDITSQQTFPYNIVWPQKPDESVNKWQE